MAKADGPGFVDKHIEKVVLLACLLVLFYALSQYGVSSKRTYEIAGLQDVAPKQLDTTLLSEARQLEKRIEDQKAPDIPPRDDLALLKTMQNDPLPLPQPADRQADGVRGVEAFALPFGTPSQIKFLEGMEGPEPAPSLAKLIEAMPVPAKPVSWAGPEIVVREMPGPLGEADINVEELPTWRAVSVYPWQELRETWRQLLRKTIIESNPVALGYEMEIQVRQSDGTWKTTQAVKPVLLPLYDSRGEEIQLASLPEYTGVNGDAVWEWLRQFGEAWTEYQLQPDYYEVWMRNRDNPSWRAHFPFDILLIYPLGAEDAAADGMKTAAKKRTASTGKTSLLNRARATYTKKTAAARRQTSPRSSHPDMMPPEPYPPDAFPPGRATRAGAAGRYPTRYTASRRTGSPTTVRPKTRAAAAKKEIEEELPEELPEIPDFETQQAAGKVLLWSHVNSIQLGKEYRCRFRMVFANPLLAYDKDLEEENRKDAYVPSVRTKWSQWSDPIHVQREVEFFVTGAFPRGNRVTVTVFAKWMDQWLMYPISQIKAGERIRGTRKVKVLNPATGETMKDRNGRDPVLEFDTGATAIRLNFERRIQVGDFVRNDVEMIYLDPKGRLKSRSLYRDRNSEEYKDLEAEAKQAASIFEPERPKVPPKKTTAPKKLLPVEFESPNLAPSGRDQPAGQDNPFEVPSRTKSRSSGRDSSSRKSGSTNR
ncbi:MAG: hypothetical protein JW849_10455 [Phycisphaerae bacterium]|nr:hypothetical protein [Phycisphaerae bacterium]